MSYSDVEFYNLESQTKFNCTISRPSSMEELSDSFMTKEEIQDLTAGTYFSLPAPGVTRTVFQHETIKKELAYWGDKLEASGKKSILITDEELLDVLKNYHAWSVPDYTNGRFTRHADRLRYVVTRKKTKVTATDVKNAWYILVNAVSSKCETDVPYVPVWYRKASLFEAYKKLAGWRAFYKAEGNYHYYPNTKITRAERRKFYRLIWDNPQEFMRK